MGYQFITQEFADGICSITLNRPEVLNSFNQEMAKELLSAFSLVKKSDTVRAVLITGNGRGFCAGQDLNFNAKSDSAEAAMDVRAIVRDCYNPIIHAIRGIEKPFICAVNGVAAGAGANIALACDFVLASSDASFIQSFCGIGLVPDSGGTFFLPRLVGLARATAMTMLGEKISAKQALEYGMIYQVYPSKHLIQKAKTFATKLAAKPTVALGLTKRALNQSFSNDLRLQLSLEEEFQGMASKTEDFREGVNSFREKRTSTFVGK